MISFTFSPFLLHFLVRRSFHVRSHRLLSTVVRIGRYGVVAIIISFSSFLHSQVIERAQNIDRVTNRIHGGLFSLSSSLAIQSNCMLCPHRRIQIHFRPRNASAIACGNGFYSNVFCLSTACENVVLLCAIDRLRIHRQAIVTCNRVPFKTSFVCFFLFLQLFILVPSFQFFFVLWSNVCFSLGFKML